MITAYIGIGTNIDREKHIEAALDELKALGTAIRISTIYECEAVGFESDAFYNLVAEVKTQLTLTDFSQALRRIENKWGREENAAKFQPRTLDLDIILFGEHVSVQKPELPRRDIYNYSFVIQPLNELCPELIVPGDGRSVREIWQESKNIESMTVVTLWF
ncbi:2-amino-4-hydroxy-6-hydroxymethyldihydropteridine diphosphokinase [Vibrio sinensis]|uniref:2-amino-4-hydroxy-6-hydroxymethyldihydropteridine diphosphokinase n=1 Tax=Vibrio sinensis TaxID=2302434 RepID=A0A3A6Q8B6_9VIBR|nr:2-amino-4-hydroxy-6-hydroxymethyldihydropteridine diphosphokinase [Vibrio sinensis]RJX67391.1 2-amino-4-hydroxy-6-hydroxymethyldihydropteridine diphosphokinase [Vibrio sinensis]